MSTSVAGLEKRQSTNQLTNRFLWASWPSPVNNLPLFLAWTWIAGVCMCVCMSEYSIDVILTCAHTG